MEAFQKLRIAAQHFAFAKACYQTFAGNFFKFIRTHQLNIFSLRRLYDAHSNRMGRNKLCTSAQTQQLVLVHAFSSINLLQHEVALRNRTGLIHNYSSNVFQRFHSHAALEENAILGACANAGEECQRYAQHQCARTADNEEGQRSVNPFIPVTGNQGRDNSSQHCGSNNKRSIDSCKAGNEAVNSRLAGSSVFHAVQNTRYHRLLEYLLDTDFQHTRGVHAAGNNLIAIFAFHRYRLTGYRGGINKAFAINNNAVQRNTVAYTHQQDIAYMCISSRNNLHLFAHQQVDNLRTQVDSIHNLTAALFYGTLLKIFAHAIEEHNANSLFPCLDSKGTQRSNSHQEVFIEHITLSDILQGSQHNTSTQQDVSKNQEIHMVRFRHQTKPFSDDEHSTAQYDFNNRLLFTKLGENAAGLLALLQLRSHRRLAFSLYQHNALFHLIGYSLHLLQQTFIATCAHTQLLRSKGQNCLIDFRHSVQRTFNLRAAVCAVQILHQINSGFAA